jgi:hypothetical protein
LRRELPRLKKWYDARKKDELAADEVLLADDTPVIEWPLYWPWAHSQQIEILPSDVVDLGEIEVTGEGDILVFNDADEGEILRRLGAHGYEIERDDTLVRAACDDRSDEVTYWENIDPSLSNVFPPRGSAILYAGKLPNYSSRMSSAV